MNSNTTNNESARLREEIKGDLNKLNQDLKSIKDRVTPGQLIDDAIFYRRGGTPAETFEHLKRNPVGTSLLTLGTLLLMEDQNHASYEALARQQVSGTFESGKAQVQRVTETARNTVTGVKEGFAKAKDSVSGKMGEVKTKLSAMKDTDEAATLDEIADFTDSAETKVQGLKSKVMDHARHLDPLVAIALGAGLGALTGASLPLSEPESKMVSGLDEKFSAFKNEISQALNDSLNALKTEVIGDLTSFNLNFF